MFMNTMKDESRYKTIFRTIDDAFLLPSDENLKKNIYTIAIFISIQTCNEKRGNLKNCFIIYLYMYLKFILSELFVNI